MTAATLVLGPIFEADLPPELFAYRAGRNAQQAVIEVEEQLFRGHPDVVDADLADYFGSIPHADLMKSVARRVVDRRVLHLIKMWLECPVEETDDRGRKTRTTTARDTGRGIPQGAPISPLLANLYMRRFVLGWKQLGLEQRLGARLVTYADDLVILCRKGNAEQALQHLRDLMSKLKLTVSEEKTRICSVPASSFDFLGYTFGQMYSARTGQARLGHRPSKKSIKRAVEKIHALTVHTGTWQETTELVGKMNRTLRGWANYFSVGTVNPAYRALDAYAAVPVAARQAQSQATSRRELSTLASLRALRARTIDPTWARPVVGESVILSESRMREICKSGSMRGMWKRSYGRAAKAPLNERGGNRYAGPNATAPHPDSTIAGLSSRSIADGRIESTPPFVRRWRPRRRWPICGHPVIAGSVGVTAPI
jgi:group II intron reverse transcriptase/maturase